MKTLRTKLERLRTETHALYLAGRDPRVAWHVRILVALVVAYALSPIDLIPDFVPVLGYLDDLILVPLGLALAVRLIPSEILDEHRAAARDFLSRRPSRSWLGAFLVAALWLFAAIWLGRVAWRAFAS